MQLKKTVSRETNSYRTPCRLAGYCLHLQSWRALHWSLWCSCHCCLQWAAPRPRLCLLLRAALWRQGFLLPPRESYQGFHRISWTELAPSLSDLKKIRQRSEAEQDKTFHIVQCLIDFFFCRNEVLRVIMLCFKYAQRSIRDTRQTRKCHI